MPLDGNEEIYLPKPDPTIFPEGDVRAGAIWLLERARRRVGAGYCSLKFYRKRWWHSTPAFCMSGALTYSDEGNLELFDRKTYDAKQLAEEIVRQIIGTSLVNYGSRPFAKRRVIRAYDRALETAKARKGI